MLITQTPLRVSLAGGGTDLASYYRSRGGAVVSAAIDKFVYVILNQRFDDKIYLSYSRKEIVDWLRQRSRPYLFSNSLAPAIVAASIRVIDLMAEGQSLREKLWENSRYFREQMTAAGFTLAGADHAIIPVMLGDAKLAAEMANRLLHEGIYVIGFSFPVVPRGQARIRTQISAAHTREQQDRAIGAFTRIGRELGVIG